MQRFVMVGWTGLIWVLALGIALASLRFVIAPFAIVMEHMAHYLPAAPVALFAHLIGAPLALALAPVQLWAGLRRRRPALHRASGYVYGLSVLIAGLGSLVLLPDFLGTGFAAAGFFALAVLWIGTTLRGVLLARAGDLAAHRRMMLRSVALTFAAVTLRILMAPLMAQGWSVTETYQITAWASWIPNLIAIEIYLRRQSKRAPMAAAL